MNSGITWQGVVGSGVVSCGAVWCSKVQCGITRDNVVWCGVWHSVSRCDVMCCGLV